MCIYSVCIILLRGIVRQKEKERNSRQRIHGTAARPKKRLITASRREGEWLIDTDTEITTMRQSHTDCRCAAVRVWWGEICAPGPVLVGRNGLDPRRAFQRRRALSADLLVSAGRGVGLAPTT